MRNCSLRIRSSPGLPTRTSRVGEPTQSTHGYHAWLSIFFCNVPRPHFIEGCLDVQLPKSPWSGTLPCLNMGVHSSCHFQCFCSRFVIMTCKFWQLVPSTLPSCNFFQLSSSFSFSRRRIIQDAYHFDITDVNAMAL